MGLWTDGESMEQLLEQLHRQLQELTPPARLSVQVQELVEGWLQKEESKWPFNMEIFPHIIQTLERVFWKQALNQDWDHRIAEWLVLSCGGRDGCLDNGDNSRAMEICTSKIVLILKRGFCGVTVMLLYGFFFPQSIWMGRTYLIRFGFTLQLGYVFKSTETRACALSRAMCCLRWGWK